MDEILISSLIDKADEQDKKIQALNEKMDKLPVYEEFVNQVKTGFEGLRTEVQKASIPEKSMLELSGRLAIVIELLRRPVVQKIVHHHHIQKTVWITAILFLITCLVLMGWFGTYNKLKAYEANDIKYRYLKLKSSVGLSKYLSFIDSLYQADPKMREYVLIKEEQNRRDIEMMKNALKIENNTRVTKKKLHKKSG